MIVASALFLGSSNNILNNPDLSNSFLIDPKRPRDQYGSSAVLSPLEDRWVANLHVVVDFQRRLTKADPDREILNY